MICLNPYIPPGASFSVPCGKCINCLVNYSNIWAQRICDEATHHQDNCFVTLTYKETDGNLHREDLVKFVKRLRARIDPIKIRVFYCGEYGGRGNRPHYHCIIFGWRPPDLREVARKGDEVYYASEYLEEVWSLGYISVGDVTPKSAKYCAKYLTKLDPRPHEVKPFTGMSRMPGIGFLSISPEMLITGVRYVDGKPQPIPKYYIDKLEEQGFNVDILRARRKEIAKAMSGEYIDPKQLDFLRKQNDIKERELLSFHH